MPRRQDWEKRLPFPPQIETARLPPHLCVCVCVWEKKEKDRKEILNLTNPFFSYTLHPLPFSSLSSPLPKHSPSHTPLHSHLHSLSHTPEQGCSALCRMSVCRHISAAERRRTIEEKRRGERRESERSRTLSAHLPPPAGTLGKRREESWLSPILRWKLDGSWVSGEERNECVTTDT